MSARYFVDTSAWLSILVASDRHHSQVVEAYSRALGDGAVFITSNLVLGELFTLLSSRQNGATAFWLFRDGLHSNSRIRVLDVSADRMDAAFNLLRNRPDKRYSFVDATSFVLMRDESVLAAFTLDRHFAQEGFGMVPGAGEPLHEPEADYSAVTSEPPVR